ncbi:WAS/WASL-interacting protein family member 1-like [Dipodomys spectabilis]|uniref:WAS/WASL-interacting protein family member 1-like n=1 Tax=Dipodomys spectabilis TaxID=105255 RepID=UPI001C547E4B|nr:WAS/WASL-interacting protein family member 1-like [Dipodomys spectabilis]
MEVQDKLTHTSQQISQVWKQVTCLPNYKGKHRGSGTGGRRTGLGIAGKHSLLTLRPPRRAPVSIWRSANFSPIQKTAGFLGRNSTITFGEVRGLAIGPHPAGVFSPLGGGVGGGGEGSVPKNPNPTPHKAQPTGQGRTGEASLSDLARTSLPRFGELKTKTGKHTRFRRLESGGGGGLKNNSNNNTTNNTTNTSPCGSPRLEEGSAGRSPPRLRAPGRRRLRPPPRSLRFLEPPEHRLALLPPSHHTRSQFFQEDRSRSRRGQRHRLIAHVKPTSARDRVRDQDRGSRLTPRRPAPAPPRTQPTTTPSLGRGGGRSGEGRAPETTCAAFCARAGQNKREACQAPPPPHVTRPWAHPRPPRPPALPSAPLPAAPAKAVRFSRLNLAVVRPLPWSAIRVPGPGVQQPRGFGERGDCRWVAGPASPPSGPVRSPRPALPRSPAETHPPQPAAETPATRLLGRPGSPPPPHLRSGRGGGC